MIDNKELNKVPKGYIKTAIGILPSDWKLVELSKLAVILFSNVDKHIVENEKKVLLCNYKDVYSNRYIFSGIKFSNGSVNENEYNKFLIKKGDIIITKDSEDSRDIAVPSYVLEDIKDLICGYHLAIIRPQSNKLNGLYLSQLLQSYNINHVFQRLANGITRFGLNTDSVKKSAIPLPDIKEQKKIAEILLNWDEAISNCSALVKVLKERNKGLSQQLLTGKKRLGGFSENWTKTQLGNITSRVTTKNEELNDTVVTISAQRGFVLQEDFFKKRVASDTLSGYYLLKKGQFAYNKSYSNGYPMGAFKRLNDFEKAVVTTLYICFELKENVCPDYMVYFFENGLMTNNLMKVAKEGGRAHGLLNIGLNDFMNLELTMPSFEEQKAISRILEMANDELKCYEAKLETLQSQKKGLMQQLLTGKIRVNVK